MAEPLRTFDDLSSTSAEQLLQKQIQPQQQIESAIKNLLINAIQTILNEELNQHLGYEEYERGDKTNYRNGKKTKILRSKYGTFKVKIPQDRKSSFEPSIVKKYQKDISKIEDLLLFLFLRDLNTNQVKRHLGNLFLCCQDEGADFVTNLTERIKDYIFDQKQRRLKNHYDELIVANIDLIVSDEQVIVYMLVGASFELERCEVLTIERKGTVNWTQVFMDLNHRGLSSYGKLNCVSHIDGIAESLGAIFDDRERQSYEY